ncbi:TetR/AcrR family transcriptional regulator [Nonomuraea diastatica]|uniref:TetR/AcrR family transcriptional regulator n=1 Tax=Nonomuraea diastatica TaxID=1848329 RepID=A0A4V2YFU6_9ACTN|nr:TetR/AcrR family transcriptional regulator [Nonomuraea diastatica]TDD24457.1 TetR/AcrR family transcriptional regulator [Nonomuraea diastatica]
MRTRLDPSRRRAAIAEAVGRVLSRGGPDALGLREVAAEAGVTTGAIQHHFTTKDGMLLFTLEHHGRRLVERLSARAGSAPQPAPPRRVLRAIAMELLPLDEERAVEARMAAAFTIRAAANPELAVIFREQYALLHTLVADQFGRAGVPDADADARELLCLIEGLRTQRLLGEIGDDTIVAMVDRVLDRLEPNALPG